MIPMRSRFGVWCAVAALAALAFAGCGGGKPSAPTEPKDLAPEQKLRMADSFFRAGRVSAALELVQHGAHPLHFSGKIAVVGSIPGAGSDEFATIACVWSDSGQNNPGTLSKLK